MGAGHDAELHAEIRRLEKQVQTVQVVLVDETTGAKEERARDGTGTW